MPESTPPVENNPTPPRTPSENGSPRASSDTPTLERELKLVAESLGAKKPKPPLSESENEASEGEAQHSEGEESNRSSSEDARTQEQKKLLPKKEPSKGFSGWFCCCFGKKQNKQTLSLEEFEMGDGKGLSQTPSRQE